MANPCRGLVLGVAMAVAVLAAGRAQEVKGPGKEVLELARAAQAGKDVTMKAVALRERFTGVRAAMNLYNPRSRGGIGFGPRGVAIERRLLDLEEQPLDEPALKKESAEWARVAHVNLVMAEITRGFAPPKPFLGKGKKEWERDVEALKKASKELAKAVEAGSPKAVQAAAKRINNACNNCHDGK
jgi:hypothetical protein